MSKRGFDGALLKSFGAKDYLVTVLRKEQLTPKYIRIHFQGPEVLKEMTIAPTAWLRFWFPGMGDDDPYEYQRGYTLKNVDLEEGTFDTDFVLHDPAGPASYWALTAQVGMTLSVTPLGSTKFEIPQDYPAGYLLLGDSASIPGIDDIITSIPPEIPIELYLEEHDPADQMIPLANHPRLRTHWFKRENAETFAAAIHDRDWSNWNVWAGLETASLKHVRKRLRDEFGFPKTEMSATGYWVEGKSMGKQRETVSVTDLLPEEEVPIAEQELEPAKSVSETSSPSKTAEPKTKTKGDWKSQAANKLLAPLKGALWLAGILQSLITLLELAPYVLLVELARTLLSGGGTDQLWSIGITAIVLFGLGIILSILLTLWLHVVDARFENALRQRLLAKLSRLPLSWFQKRSSGSVKQLVQDDTVSLHYLVTHAVIDAVAAVVAPLAVLGYLFVLDWRIFAVMLIPVLVYIVAMYFMLVQSADKTPRALSWAEQMNGEANSYLQGQPVIRVFGGSTASRFHQKLKEYIQFLNDWQLPFVKPKALMDLATRPATFLLLIVLMGTLLITNQAMEPLTLVPFLLLGTTFGVRLLGIGYGMADLRTGLLAARRIQNTLDEQELILLPQTREQPVQTQAAGSVSFDDVGFEYYPGAPILEGIKLKLKPGTVTALVGPSGAGKSTMAALLARFNDVSSGAITITTDEGVKDIRELSSDELYQHIGFVFQDNQLIAGTVAENIALAVPNASNEQIRKAAKAAQIHDRIMKMPDGYGSLVDSDSSFSGGEKQRLTIARAILADTPILVLDEATAFADPESEFLVQQALNEISKNRTVLVIAHRLYTIKAVDNIVVLENGKIVETGTHQQLLQRGGRYNDLWLASSAQQKKMGAEK